MDPHAFQQLKASAGSGKTYALTGRFLDLLSGASARPSAAACGPTPGDGWGWSEIMAVTFTVKAAAEMKQRVVECLKNRALSLESGQAGGMSPRAARAWLERILRRYDRLNIRTIDSLGHLLLTIFALDLGVPPDFEVVFDIKDLFDDLFDRVAARAEAGGQEERRALEQAMETMLHLEQSEGFDLSAKFRKRLLDIVRFRLGDPDPAPLDGDARAMQADIEALLKTMQAELRGMYKVLGADNLPVQKNFINFLDRCAALDIRATPPKSVYSTKESLALCLLKAGQGRVTETSEQAYDIFKQAFTAYANGHKVLSKARNLAGFAGLSNLLLAEIDRHRRENGVLLNSSWPALAHDLLNHAAGVPEAFCRMGSRLHHLLIDEFQDTSRDQWRAMQPLAEECLSKGGGLFYVGDVKQAIYGWRGGEARLFDEIGTLPELAAMSPAHSDALDTNWRSMRRIVEFNNRIFGPLAQPETAQAAALVMLPAEPPQDVVNALAASIAGSFADAFQMVCPKNADTGGYARLERVTAKDVPELNETVRDRLHDLFMDDICTRRPPGDVAVLVRGNAEAAMVAEWLISWGLPVITENSLGLDEHPVVRQLLALMAFLDYPGDDTAFWDVVSGSEVFGHAAGPGPEELTDWLAGRAGSPLYLAYARDFPESFARLAPLMRKAGLMGPYDTAREAVAAFALLERHPGHEVFIRRFLEAVHGAEKLDCLSLSSFLEYWKDHGADEKVPLPEGVDAVRVMTMHKAKGLEFPVVVVPFHHWGFSPHRELAAHDGPRGRLLTPLMPELGKIFWDRAMDTLQEQLNLLYVAWTRPVEEFYGITTSTKRHAGNCMVRLLNVLIHENDFNEDEDGLPYLESGRRPAPGIMPRPGPDLEAPAPPGPETIDRPMAWLPRLKIHRHFAQGMTRDEILDGGRAFDEKARGSLVHDAMDRLRLTGDPAADSDRAVRQALAQAVQAMPPNVLSPEELDGLASGIGDILAWAMALPEMPGWLNKGLPEQPILDAEGNEHRPDLLVMDGDETIVVEYKTGAPAPEHEDQVRRYLGLARDMGRPEQGLRGVLVYLDRRQCREVEFGGRT